MFRSSLFAALVLILSGSQALCLQIAPKLPVTDADFTNALAKPPTSGPLGLTPKLQGRTEDWSIPTPRPVFMDVNRNTVIGTIDGSGKYDITLSAHPPKEEQTTLKQLIQKFNGYGEGDCSVDTLVISAPDAMAAKLWLYVPREVPAADAKPESVFSSLFTIDFELFPEYFNTIETTVYSSVAATAKGELSCKDRDKRYHLFVNISFSPGWNTTTVLYGEARKIGGETVQKLLLKGGLGRSGLD
ncbi:hypothetical protein [Deinococcus humi]|uniref:Uncharacterized protein n=1 Tax=Deinococcus humi TaxID=662880 RepID=A0A7W8NHQ7_9DEIO|nr:hypothetical protein [Deinococcus humi]MBB5364262.1 hypothetical protein [Deinococcus humi]GGO35378.1 hypothetical protein GCM10008949_37730 [Deinococcus humi]